MRTDEQILRDLADILAAAFPDRDTSAPAEAGTRVMGDLGLASIDLIVLGERLQAFYGKRLPFGAFLAGVRTRGADDLEVGELVAFLRPHV
jgi:acyl carrier protein